MSEYRCGNCGTKYTITQYRDLETVPVDPENPEKYGNETVCGQCDARMHSETWKLQETITGPDDTEVRVSTVALLIGHGPRHDQWFETCLFYDEGSSVVDRYHTQSAAEEGHAEYVERVQNGAYHFESTGSRMVIDR